MGKRTKLYERSVDGSYCQYVELQPSTDGYTTFGFEVQDNGTLGTWACGESVFSVPVSAKKARKFARALLKLADQVDPPAPKTEYFHFHPEFLYRVIDGGRPHYWDKYHGWTKSFLYETAYALMANREVVSIPRKYVPKDAR